MEVTEFTKIIFGMITATGTAALTYFNLSQTRKVTAELLEKFEVAIEKSQKHSVTEIFRLIHGLRMSYSDIMQLIQHDECSKIIFALRKTPGIVCYRNGTFQYTPIGKSSAFKFFDIWSTRFTIGTFSVLTLSSFLLLVFGDGTSSVLGFVFMIMFSYLLGTQLRQNRHDQMITSLVNDEI